MELSVFENSVVIKCCMVQESDCFHNTVLGIKHPSCWKWRYTSFCWLHKCRRKSAIGSHKDEVIYTR